MKRQSAFAWGLLALLVFFLAPILFTQGFIQNFGDLYAFYHPLRHLASARLQSGQLPLWNPYIFSGTPFLANPQVGLFYPLNVLFQVFGFRTAMQGMTLLHLWLAAWGFHLVALKLTRKPWASLLGALAYAASPWMTARLAQGVPTLLYGYAWMPWLAIFCLPRRSRPILIVGLGIAGALQFLSGHLQVFLISLLMLSLVTVAKPRLAGRLAGGLLLAGFLVALQALPTQEFLRASLRSEWGLRDSLAYSLPPVNLMTLIRPDIFGNPWDKTFVPQDKPSLYFEGNTLYAGLIPLLLAAAGLIVTLRRRRWVWALILFGSLFTAFGEFNPLLVKMVRPLELWHYLRAPARFAGAGFFALAVLAVYGASVLKKLGPFARWLPAALCLFVFGDLYAHTRKSLQSENPEPYLSVNPVVFKMEHTMVPRQYRILTDQTLSNPNKSMLYRQFNVAGYEAFYLKSMAVAASLSEGHPAAESVRVDLSRYDTPIMNALGVFYYLTPQAIPNVKPIFQDAGLFVYENLKARPLADSPDGKNIPFLYGAEPEHWRIKPKPGQWIVASIPHFPGWRAFQGGKSLDLVPANFLSQAVRAETGSILHLFFRSLSFLIGLIFFTLPALTGVGIYLAVKLQRWARPA